MLYTVSAVQILVTIDALDQLDKHGRHDRNGVGRCMITKSFVTVDLGLM